MNINNNIKISSNINNKFCIKDYCIELSNNRQILELSVSLVSSIAKIIIVQPFDFIRFRIQTTKSKDTGFKNFFSSLIKKEGISVFFKGGSITSLMVILNSTIHMTLFQEILTINQKNLISELNNQKHINNTDNQLKHLSITNIINYVKLKNKKNAISNNFNNIKEIKHYNNKLLSIYFKTGLITGALSSFIFAPFDNLRIRLISENNLIGLNDNKKYIYKNAFSAMKLILKSEGIKGLFTALHMCILKESLGTAFYFWFFECSLNYINIKKNINYINNKQQYKKYNKNFLLTFLCGGGAGLCNWIITMPVDIIKTKIISYKINSNAKDYLKLSTCIFNIYKENGILGFYKGFKIIFFRSIIVNGFTLSVFDYLRDFTGLKY